MKRIPTYKTHLTIAVAIVALSVMSVLLAPHAHASTGSAGGHELLQAAGSSASEGDWFAVGAAVGLLLVGGATILIRTRGR